jgi:hypothetical protein
MRRSRRFRSESTTTVFPLGAAQRIRGESRALGDWMSQSGPSDEELIDGDQR